MVLADGAVTRSTVTKVVQYVKTSFPDRLVYGSHGIRSLQLVTCGAPSITKPGTTNEMSLCSAGSST